MSNQIHEHFIKEAPGGFEYKECWEVILTDDEGTISRMEAMLCMRDTRKEISTHILKSIRDSEAKQLFFEWSW